MSQTARKIVERSENVISCYSSYSLKDLNALCSKAIAQYVLPEFEDTVTFDVETYSEAYDESTYAGMFMKYRDYESEDECAKREAQESIHRARIEERDRAEFERLNKKFSASN